MSHPQPLTAKAALHEYYVRHLNKPTFDVQPVQPSTGPEFLCELVIPATRSPLGYVAETKFFATERSKKGAEQHAARLALEFIEAMGMLPSSLRVAPSNLDVVLSNPYPDMLTTAPRV